MDRWVNDTLSPEFQFILWMTIFVFYASKKGVEWARYKIQTKKYNSISQTKESQPKPQ